MNINHHSASNNAAFIVANLQHETLDIDALKFPKHVPKQLADKAVQALMRAIARTGQQIFPALVDDQNVIISGFELVAAMHELGANEIGVVRLSSLTEAETKAIMLLLAKIPERSTWDEIAVADILEEIAIDDPDALDITGFEVAEIDVALGYLAGPPDPASSAYDDKEYDQSFADAMLATPPIVERGDVFLLGGHRIICGNSLEAATYKTLMDGHQAAAILTDPPYNIPIAGHASGMGKNQHQDFAMGVGEMNFDQFTDFLRTMLALVAAELQPGGLLFVFMDRRHLEELYRAVRKAGLRMVDLAIWNKLSGGMGGLYRGQHEPCVVACAGDGPVINNVQLGKFGRYRTNVWDFRGYSAFGKDRTEALAAHPTVKPWSMLAEIILDCTKRGDVILDPFLGSGSTVLAATKTSRRCFGIELEPKYVEVAIARWEKMAGAKAVHQATGLTLDELRTSRHKQVLHLSSPCAESEVGHG